MSAAPQRTFFDDVVEASGLAPLVAPFTITRLLIRAGVTPTAVDPLGLRQALPELERGLAVYLTPEQLDAAVGRLRGLAAL
ncbi:MAG TPA: hypothetical protein VNT58_12015 [Gaiellaceae bacterium]|nr:hypothetical protein [Gaiellaceae bacterium]